MNITLSPLPENVADAIEALIDAPAPGGVAPDLSVRYTKRTPSKNRQGEGEYLEVSLEYLDYRAYLTARMESVEDEKDWRLSMGYKTIASTHINPDMSAGDIISEVNRLLLILKQDFELHDEVRKIRG